MWIGAGIVIALVAMFIGGTVLLSWRRPELGSVDGRLRPCGPAPNCVCSQSADNAHAIAPLQFAGEGAAEFERLRTLIVSLPHTRLVEQTDGYARYEFATPLLRYVDDVEFLLDTGQRVIHVRSASRVGYSDVGANRKRVESIRERFSASGRSDDERE